MQLFSPKNAVSCNLLQKRETVAIADYLIHCKLVRKSPLPQGPIQWNAQSIVLYANGIQESD